MRGFIDGELPGLVVDTLGYKAVIYKIERVACTDGTDPMCWITDTGYIRADICPSWLPIPPADSDTGEGDHLRTTRNRYNHYT